MYILTPGCNYDASDLTGVTSTASKVAVVREQENIKSTLYLDAYLIDLQTFVAYSVRNIERQDESKALKLKAANDQHIR